MPTKPVTRYASRALNGVVWKHEELEGDGPGDFGDPGGSGLEDPLDDHGRLPLLVFPFITACGQVGRGGCPIIPCPELSSSNLTELSRPDKID